MATTDGEKRDLGAVFDEHVGDEFVTKRLDYVEQGVPTVLWIALIVGAIVTIGFATLFDRPRSRWSPAASTRRTHPCRAGRSG